MKKIKSPKKLMKKFTKKKIIIRQKKSKIKRKEYLFEGKRLGLRDLMEDELDGFMMKIYQPPKNKI